MAEEAGRPVRRRILLSVMACSPQIGSEPGVGWNWLLHLATRYEIVVLTHAHYRSHLEPALQRLGLDVEVIYLQAPAFGWHPDRQLNSRIYYVWWQWRARAVVRRLLSQRSFDLVHHLTWGSLRLPCFLGGLGVPLVMGPLGGGDWAPMRLYRGLPLRHCLLDFVRLLSLSWVQIDPLATFGTRRSALVLCKSRQSLLALPRDVQARALLVPEIGCPELLPRQPAALPSSGKDAKRTFKLLFAGRLIALKGVSIAIGVMSRLVNEGWDVELDIAGDGPLRAFHETEIARAGLGNRIRLLGSVPRSQLLERYAAADLFLFPSLRDSSGNVVLESLSRGLPVVCLDLGGPGNFIDETCGVIVQTDALDRSGLEASIARHVSTLFADPERLQKMSDAALLHAGRQSWPAVVHRAYDVIAGRLGW